MVSTCGRKSAALALCVGLLGAAGCAELEGVLAQSIGGRAVEGELRSLDERRGRMQVRQQRGGTVTLRYDRSTRVFYAQREYPPSALERGDVVRVRVSHDRSGEAWADRVDVLRSRAATGRVERLDGRVAQVVPSRGHFTVVRGREVPIVVYVPPNVRREDLRRLDRLRTGDRVRLDVLHLGPGEVELVRFR
jgi:hypothetical protein